MSWDLAGKGLTGGMGICWYALLVMAGLVGSLVPGGFTFEKRCRKSPSSGPINLGCLRGLLPCPFCLEPVCVSSVKFSTCPPRPLLPSVPLCVCLYLSSGRLAGYLSLKTFVISFISFWSSVDLHPF